MSDINSIDDEDVLYKMLNSIDDFDQRKKIRARIRDVREARAAEIALQRKEREESKEDAVQLRQRRAEEAKQRKLKEYDEQAKQGKKDVGTVEKALREKLDLAEAEKQRKIQSITDTGKAMTQVYHSGSDILKKAEGKGANQVNEEGVSSSTKLETNDGGSTTTSTTVTTQKTKDGSTTVIKQTKQISQTSGIGGTSYSIPKSSAAKAGPRGARAAFQQMDKAAAPPGGAKSNVFGANTSASSAGRGGGGRVAVQRSPSAIKQMLLDWCKAMTREYEPKVCITNFSGAWSNGLAFCALIHHFYPEAFNFDELDPKNRRYNFTLAFDTAEKEADIAPLLDVDDMVRMKNPDWKCVFCYVQSFYRRFRAESNPKTNPVKEQ